MSVKLKAWIQASRAPFFVATLIPLTLGGIIAAKQDAWNGLRWSIVFLASFLVHLATNLANDYFEYESGADEGESIGGSRVLQQGKLSMAELGNALYILYFAAFLCGVWILYISRLWWLAPLMAFSFFSSVFYTAPPIRYGYHGLGEAFVAINMGTIMITGTAAVLIGHFTVQSFWISLPVAFSVALILFYQSLSDIEIDRSVGKFTTAVRLGKNRAIWGYRFLAAGTVIAMIGLVLRGFIHPLGWLSVLTLIPAYKIDNMIRSTQDWKLLHDRGGAVRLFYFVNGLILIAAAAC